MTVFQGLEVPKRLVEYGWSAKSTMYTREDAVKVAEECGVQIISITGTDGTIGAVAAIGCVDLGPEAAGVQFIKNCLVTQDVSNIFKFFKYSFHCSNF